MQRDNTLINHLDKKGQITHTFFHPRNNIFKDLAKKEMKIIKNSTTYSFLKEKQNIFQLTDKNTSIIYKSLTNK